MENCLKNCSPSEYRTLKSNENDQSKEAFHFPSKEEEQLLKV